MDVVRSREPFVAQFTSVLRFAGLQPLQNWIESEQRLQLITEVEPLLYAGDQLEITQGEEFWLIPETAQTPPR